MRKYFIIITIISITAACCSCANNKVKDGTSVLTAKISGLDTNIACKAEEDSTIRNGIRIDSLRINLEKNDTSSGNLKVSFNNVKTPKVQEIFFRSKKLTRSVKVPRGTVFFNDDCDYLHVIIMPGKKIMAKGKLTKYCEVYPYGDPENDLLANYERNLYPLLHKLSNLKKTLYFDAKNTKIQEAKKVVDTQIHNLKIKLLDEHISSVAALWILDKMISYREISIPKAAKYITKVSPEYKKLQYYNNIVQKLAGYNSSTVGKIAHIITGENMVNGKPFSSESLKGKYVILDFWGTWCGPCVSGMPAMKKLRDANKDKLQIIAIANDGVKAVKQFIKDRGYDWPSILSKQKGHDYVKEFCVSGFPTKILLSPSGKILYRITDENEGFYKKVKQLIK